MIGSSIRANQHSGFSLLWFDNYQQLQQRESVPLQLLHMRREMLQKRNALKGRTNAQLSELRPSSAYKAVHSELISCLSNSELESS